MELLYQKDKLRVKQYLTKGLINLVKSLKPESAGVKKPRLAGNAVKLSDVVPAKAGIHAELAGHAPHGFPHSRE
ncbi:hypothetical protein [Duganella sp. BuS-21]|uniref:hypothetical protein n=1 Tax=Duganella sp. BuS-21 TaxID=2943848 RepID=UPI0035A68013